MTYGRFEELPVWNSAVAWGHGIYTLVDDRVFNTTGDLRDQLQRSSLSVSNNIAEGFERGSTAELLYFLYVARGSAGEARSALWFANGLQKCHHLKSQISNLLIAFGRPRLPLHFPQLLQKRLRPPPLPPFQLRLIVQMPLPLDIRVLQAVRPPAQLPRHRLPLPDQI